MYCYFKDDGNIIGKYNVSFDRNVIASFRKEIIDKCSLIIHHDMESMREPYLKDTLKIRNYTKIQISKGKIDNTKLNGRVTYRMIYDEYKFPYLAFLIERILEGDIYALDEVFNINEKKEEMYICSSGNRLSVVPFYKKLIELMNFELVDSISRDEVRRINEFFNRNDELVHLRIPFRKKSLYSV